MKKRIVIYGGTDLSAAESSFVTSLSYALLSSENVTIITGGFHYYENLPGAVSTDYSVLQGALQYASVKSMDLIDCLETWLPDAAAENDPQKKNVVRFREGNVKHLIGESAQARRFSMVRDVDVLITVKGKVHTSSLLDFALTINKPALPLGFTGGDSKTFWNVHKERVKKWFDITDECAVEFDVEKVEDIPPPAKHDIIRKIVAVVQKGIENESSNEKHYYILRSKWKFNAGSDTQFLSEPEVEYKKWDSRERVRKKKLSMFFSYSHKDDKLREDLDKHLTALKRSDKISVWYDKDIEGGSNWDETIKEELRNADIILLLISPDFMASEYIWKVELKYALEKAKQGLVKVIPIFLRRVYMKDMPFEKMQGYISTDKPIASFPEAERDEAFYKVVEGLSSDVEKWLM